MNGAIDHRCSYFALWFMQKRLPRRMSEEAIGSSSIIPVLLSDLSIPDTMIPKKKTEDHLTFVFVPRFILNFLVNSKIIYFNYSKIKSRHFGFSSTAPFFCDNCNTCSFI